jgi:hypothetical protein
MGHQVRECPSPGRERSCAFCNKPYHNTHECPFVWRQYIFKRDIVLTDVGRISCGMCGEEGHFRDECRSGRPARDPGLYSLKSLLPPGDVPFKHAEKKAGEKRKKKDKKSEYTQHEPKKGVVPDFRRGKSPGGSRGKGPQKDGRENYVKLPGGEKSPKEKRGKSPGQGKNSHARYDDGVVSTGYNKRARK